MDELPMPLLAASRSTILQRWFQLIVDGYPTGVGRFLASETDLFANPVGQTIRRQWESVLDALLAGRAGDEVTAALDDIVRIRAVQELGAAPAVSFVLQLKDALAEALVPAELSAAELNELREFEGRIDRLLLLAFDLYLRDRERVYEIRAKELTARSAKLIERLGKK